MKTIFVVDDNNTNLAAARDALDSAYQTFALSSAARMFKLIENVSPDLILLDLIMPEMGGFEALALLKANPKLKMIPVILLTANNDTESEIRGFELGAVDFIAKPFSPPVLLKRIQSQIDMDIIVKNSLEAVNDIHNATISVIANMVESRDAATGNHIEKTQIYLEILINELIRTGVYSEETSKWNLSLLIPSAQLHDVGKISISDTILNKPGKLTSEEFGLIKRHCAEGERIINNIIEKIRRHDFTFLHYAKRFAISHHEKWDGSGYPEGLAGENIPLEGRLMALVDVYDALVSGDRPYKGPFPHEQAVEMIQKESGAHFDPKIVDAFMSVADDFRKEAVSGSVQQHSAATS